MTVYKPMGDNKENEEKFVGELRKYYREEYMKILNLDSIEDIKTRNFLKKSDLVFFSHKNRINGNIQLLKYNYTTHRTNMITACFKVSLDETSCIYAYLYSTCKQNNSIKHIFVCTGSTFKSQDGEYRSRVLSWSQYEGLIKYYSSIFDKVEEYVVGLLESGRLSFQTDFYHIEGYNYNKRKYENNINEMRLPIKLFIMCWLHDFYQIHNKVVENHINPAYQYIIYQKEGLDVFNSIKDEIGSNGYITLLSNLSQRHINLSEKFYALMPLQCGQKLFPLSAFEAIRTDDINFSVWREIYITNLASNLVLNLISPSFPFINNWFYIQNAHAGLFDNIAMHDKYKHSDIADEISTQLKATDKLNYTNNDRSIGPISHKFYRLSRNIHKAIIYADSDIKLTDLAVCVTSEYVGRTLRDIPSLIIQKDALPGLEQAFTDNDIFTKHMFEYIYALYCMNTKIGVLHGDAHMNNITINRVYLMMDEKNKTFVPNPHVAYIVDGMTYVFKHLGLFSTIIDFSRAIIGDYKRLEHEFSPRFAEIYFKEQRSRVMNIIYHYFPKFMESFHDKIESLLTNEFPLMFKILTAIDTYIIMGNIATMFTIDEAFAKNKIKIASGAMKLLRTLSSMAEKLLTDNLQVIIEGRISSVDDIEWPNLTIIKKIFAPNLLTPELMTSDITVVDIFNFNNDVIYDTEDYDTWGPLLKIDKEVELRKKYKINVFPELRHWNEYKEYDESDAVDALTHKYEQKEADVLQIESWMLM